MTHYKATVIKHPSCHKILSGTVSLKMLQNLYFTQSINETPGSVSSLYTTMNYLHLKTVSYVTYFETNLHQNVPTYFLCAMLKIH
jgi:hypothetical protein